MAHVGHFSRCRAISNLLEGTFCERMAEGAFTRTIEEKRDQIRCLFHHGGDPSVGFKPFGVIERLEPDTRYEVALFDKAEYVRSLLPGLRAGQYGVSFRFKVLRDEIRKYPTRSAHNPKQLPEVTAVEADLTEFGPTATPAYKGPVAAVRSSGGLEGLLRELRTGAHLLAQSERWRSRPKPGCPGVVQRERITVGQVASWENDGEDAWWALPRTSDWRLT
jgi:phage head maturation protease